MATSCVLTAVDKSDPGGKVYIRYADGTEKEFPDLASAKVWALQADNDIEMTRRMNAAYALSRSTDWNNIATVANKTFTFDLSNPSPIKVQ